jgi:hypothetical protein
MTIEIFESNLYTWRQPYTNMLGHKITPTLSEAVAAFFRDYGFRGTTKPVSIHRGYVQVEITGTLPEIFSTNGQAHNTVFYRKVG